MSNPGETAVSSQTSYEGISDLLRCYICFDRLKDAVMCPHCSKICCYHCIQKWICTGKPECPHCRVRLKDCDLIRVPSVQDLSDFIGSKKPQSTDKEFCSVHPQMALTVFCETCGICICSNCALWGEHRENQGHSIKPVEELYKQNRKLLEKKLSKLQERLKEILSLVEHIEITMDGTKSQRNKTQQEIDKVVEDIFGRLNDQLRKKLQGLTNDKRYLKRQACQITTISTEIEGKIKGSQSLIVSQKDELQERLTNALRELEGSRMLELEKRPEMGSFDNEIVPPYETAVFEIKDFSKKKQAGVEIFSNHLTFCGLSWRLKVYPNGTQDFTGRYLGVFVELYDGYSQTAMYNYFVEIVYGAGHYKSSRPRSTGNFKRDYGSDFAVGEAWGYKKFYEIRNLESKGFLVKDTVLLKFGVRHPTFHQKCRDSFLYVNDLKHKIMALKHENSQLRRKCEGISEEIDDTALLKMKNKSRKVKSPKDIQEQSLEEMTTTKTPKEKEKKSIETRKQEEQIIDEIPSTNKRDSHHSQQQAIEDDMGSSERLTSNSTSSIGGQQHQQYKLSKTPMSLSQPHLYSVHPDIRMQHRMEKDSSRRSSAIHSTHSMLVSSPGQRTRHHRSQQQQQQSQGTVNYGHCIPHRRISDEPSQTVIDQRRQSYEGAGGPSRVLPQQMLYDQSQSMMMPPPPQQHPMYPGSLSQADYMMMSHRGGGNNEYYMAIRESPSEQHQDWMMGGMVQSQQTNPTRRQQPPPSHQMRKEFENSQSDISNFMDDPGSPGTFNGELFSSQFGPSATSYGHLSQELDTELSDTRTTSPVDDSLVSQKIGYGMMDMSQPMEQMLYGRRKSTDLTDSDHLSRSIHTLPNDGRGTLPNNGRGTLPNDGRGLKGDSGSRKPVRTRSVKQVPSQTNIKKMGSEPQLNMHGPPGLLSSIAPRLTAPIEQIRPNTSSTLPRNVRSSSNGGTGKSSHSASNSTTGSAGHIGGNNAGNPNTTGSSNSRSSQSHGQRFKQPPKMGNNSERGGEVAALTQPNPSSVGLTEERKQVNKHEKPQTERSSPPTNTSTITEHSVVSTTPVQNASPNNQKLRSSGRSYRMTKKSHDGRSSSPSKSALSSNALFKQPASMELNLEMNKTPPIDNSSTATPNRLAVGGNITNNSSLSQLDKLL